MFKELKFIHITKTAGTSIEDLAHKNGIYWGRFHKEYGDIWHKPFIEIENGVKQKYDWFTIVRNPYDRIISEFYCRWIPPYSNQNQYSKTEFNLITRQNILNHKNDNQIYDFHYTPQHKYIDNNYNITILKYEDLPNNFNTFIKEYNLNFVLDKDKKNQNINRKFNLHDFDLETLKLINVVYNEDFGLFNYSKIEV